MVSKRKQLEEVIKQGEALGLVAPSDVTRSMSKEDMKALLDALKVTVNVNDLPIVSDVTPGIVPPFPHEGMFLVSGKKDELWQWRTMQQVIAGGGTMTAAQILTLLLTVDGAGSLLDADLLDGNHATAFAVAAHLHAGVYEPVDATLVRTSDVNYTDLTDGGGTTLHTHSYEPIDATIVRTGQVNWIDLTDGGGTTLHTHAYEPIDATIVRTGLAAWIDLTDGGATTLHSHAAPAGMGDVLDSGIVVGQLVKGVTDSKHVTSAALIPPATNILTLTNSAASTLALAITAAKTLTLTAANDYNLTIPETGTAALLATANVFTTTQTINAAAVAGREALVVCTVSDAGYDKFGISNATTTAGRFLPTFYGFHDTGNNFGAMVFRALVTSANDAVGATGGMMQFGAYRTSNQADPNSGSLTDIVNRAYLFTFSVATNVYLLTIIPNGNVGINVAVPLGKLHVVGSADDEIAIFKGFSTQTNHVVEVRDSSDNIHSFLSVPGAASALENVFNETGSQYLDFRVETNTYDALFVDASNESIVLMSNAAGKVGFFGATAVVQQTELTDELTSVTCSAPGTPDYAIADLVNVGGYGFVSLDEGLSLIKVVANLQTRVNELETKLVAYGLLVDAD